MPDGSRGRARRTSSSEAPRVGIRAGSVGQELEGQMGYGHADVYITTSAYPDHNVYGLLDNVCEGWAIG